MAKTKTTTETDATTTTSTAPAVMPGLENVTGPTPPPFNLLSAVRQPTSGKAGAIVDAAIANAAALGFTLAAGLDRERLAADVGRLLANTDRGSLSGKGGAVRATFDWSGVSSLTPHERAMLTCAGAVALAADKYAKALVK